MSSTRPLITIDLRMSNHPGIGRYARTLVRHLLSLPSLPGSLRLLGAKPELEALELPGSPQIVDCRVPIYSPWEQWQMPRFYRGSDLVHVPHFNAALHHPHKLVVTLHDFIYLDYPEYEPFLGARFFLKAHLKSLAKRADAIIAVSRYTQSECERRFPSMRPKLRTIYEAAEPHLGRPPATSRERVQSVLGGKEPFVLYVGSLREHKNVQGLLKAYERFLQSRKEPLKLVLVGKLDRRFAVKYGWTQWTTRYPGIHHFSSIGDEMLSAFYNQAICLVYPSFYEGFGLPVLEGMLAGLPVIASNRTSIPEIAGNAALLFDPSRVDHLEELLYNLFCDKELREECVRRGRHQAAQFSWSKAALETAELYNSLL